MPDPSSGEPAETVQVLRSPDRHKLAAGVVAVCALLVAGTWGDYVLGGSLVVAGLVLLVLTYRCRVEIDAQGLRLVNLRTAFVAWPDVEALGEGEAWWWRVGIVRTSSGVDLACYGLWPDGDGDQDDDLTARLNRARETWLRTRASRPPQDEAVTRFGDLDRFEVFRVLPQAGLIWLAAGMFVGTLVSDRAAWPLLLISAGVIVVASAGLARPWTARRNPSRIVAPWRWAVLVALPGCAFLLGLAAGPLVAQLSAAASLIAALLLFFCWVDLEPDGLNVVNPFGSRRVAWRELAPVKLLYVSRPAITWTSLRTQEGVEVFAVALFTIKGRQWIKAQSARLEALRKQAAGDARVLRDPSRDWDRPVRNKAELFGALVYSTMAVLGVCASGVWLPRAVAHGDESIAYAAALGLWGLWCFWCGWRLWRLSRRWRRG